MMYFSNIEVFLLKNVKMNSDQSHSEFIIRCHVFKHKIVNARHTYLHNFSKQIFLCLMCYTTIVMTPDKVFSVSPLTTRPQRNSLLLDNCSFVFSCPLLNNSSIFQMHISVFDLTETNLEDTFLKEPTFLAELQFGFLVLLNNF